MNASDLSIPIAAGTKAAASGALATDELDRRIVLATQGGLPLVPRPYAVIAARLGASEDLVRARLAAMLADGRIRRIGAVPNHYAIGYTANGMSVWDVDDAVIDAAGERVGALAFVTHCYRRPRHLPDWPYNLFAMVHAASREAALARVGEIAALLEREFGSACRSHDVLFSAGILKKTGLRIGV
ncbi:Lrp/AsnC family transcriptional regulator [Thauera aromatica]|uniref:siroheme decarboxylase subunit beta n=1 Tax=Thauera aromatica TaxID=59405 RepID=UPI001FFCC0B2|nr:Lrp/AsnC family transcriptional regulator [Thauera aromatica]MCK2094717.1 Lrp/AsnC family transcriptional regulator [Thauera aromatica]